MPAPRAEIPRREASTLSLRIPRVDWAAVSAGTKTQLRAAGRSAPRFQHVKPPRPIVLYSFLRYRDTGEYRLHVLEDVFHEPLGAITPEGLAAEGMPDLKEFRRYWSARHSDSGFRPLTSVTVYCLRPWRDGDREYFADVLLTYLYGPWLP